MFYNPFFFATFLLFSYIKCYICKKTNNMPLTSLLINEKKIVIITQPHTLDDGKIGTHVSVFDGGDDFLPKGRPEIFIKEIDQETFHRTLRIDAMKQEHFVPRNSTNPEWTEGYIAPLDLEDTEEPKQPNVE